jgi:hypothetical protein
MAYMEVKPVVLTGNYVRLEPMTMAHAPALAEIGVGQTKKGPTCHSLRSIWHLAGWRVLLVI